MGANQTYDAGLDFGFFNNRLTGSVDVYLRKTKDLLAVIPVPAGSNLSNTLLTNIGSLENRGVELALNYRVLQGPAPELVGELQRNHEPRQDYQAERRWRTPPTWARPPATSATSSLCR